MTRRPYEGFWGRNAMAAIVRDLAASRRLSAKQCDRLFKLLSDEFYLLSCSVAATESPEPPIVWTISGSTRNIYRVTLHTDGVLFCNCPDHRSHCQKHRIVCKHVCFVLCRIARIDNPDVFIERRLPQETIATLQVRMTYWRDMYDVLDRELCDRFAALETSHETAATIEARPLESDAECAICFDVLVQEPVIALEHCTSCRNTLHAACIRKWLETQTRCVYCRGPWAASATVLRNLL